MNYLKIVWYEKGKKIKTGSTTRHEGTIATSSLDKKQTRAKAKTKKTLTNNSSKKKSKNKRRSKGSGKKDGFARGQSLRG